MTLLRPYIHQHLIEAGCDEAGRGCLAGPVFAAAVILPKDFYHPALNDSKKISANTRAMLKPIIEKAAVAYSVSQVSPRMIDKINILQASFRAMHLAIAKLHVSPDILLIDGHLFRAYKKIPHECIVKGDEKIASIAAASILAKTYRDDYMLRIAKKYPQYKWQNNKGYGTQAHREAIAAYGTTPHHRLSFNGGQHLV